MAIEYVLDIATTATVREVLADFARRLHCRLSEDGFASRDGLELTAATVPAATTSARRALFGDVPLTSLTFRTVWVEDEEEHHHDVIDLFAAVVSYLDERPQDRAVLVFDGTRMLLGRLDGPVVLDTDWKIYTGFPSDPALDRVQQGRKIKNLDQLFV
jgi:hypothetical protein